MALSGLPLTWEVRLGDQMPQKRLIVGALACLAGLIALALYRNVLLAIVSPVIVIFAVAELFLPIRYKLDEKGATSACGLAVTTIEWESVQRVLEDTDGVRLSPTKTSTKASVFRGVYLRFNGNQEPVLATIRALTKGNERNLGNRPDGGEEDGASPEGGRQDHSAEASGSRDLDA